MNENKITYEVFVSINMSDRYYIYADSLEEAEKLAEEKFKEEYNLSDKPDILKYIYSSGGECGDD